MNFENQLRNNTELQSYIENKKQALRDMAFQNTQIDSMRWCCVETKAQADQVFYHVIEKFL